LPDAKRFKTVAEKQAEASADPRLALAQQYLKTATVDVAEKEKAERRTPRGAARSGTRARAFSLSVTPATFAHVLLAPIAFTFAALTLLWCYILLMTFFEAGRIIALPTGVIVFSALSYISVLYLGIIETTSLGQTEVDSLPSDWREWFWTLPSTVGMLAIAAFVGWFLSLGMPVNVWVLIAICGLLLYPILQLSALETGSPLQPLSIPVLKSIGQHPLGWFLFYAISFAVVNVLWAIGRFAWCDPPYFTVIVMAPLVCLALLFYAWLLGQLAYLISTEKE
jgi:hypothetical protein